MVQGGERTLAAAVRGGRWFPAPLPAPLPPSSRPPSCRAPTGGARGRRRPPVQHTRPPRGSGGRHWATAAAAAAAALTGKGRAHSDQNKKRKKHNSHDVMPRRAHR